LHHLAHGLVDDLVLLGRDQVAIDALGQPVEDGLQVRLVKCAACHRVEKRLANRVAQLLPSPGRVLPGKSRPGLSALDQTELRPADGALDGVLHEELRRLSILWIDPSVLDELRDRVTDCLPLFRSHLIAVGVVAQLVDDRLDVEPMGRLLSAAW